MLKSMTGYGKADLETDSGRFVVEIRSVNHRYGEITVKLPRILYPFENELKKTVAARLKRGKIEIYVQYEQVLGQDVQPRINLPLAKGYYDALASLRDSLGMYGEIPLTMVASQKDVLQTASAEELPDALSADLVRTVILATDRHEEMRQKEGASLLEEFASRRENLGNLIAQVAERAPEVVRELGDKVRERVAALLADTSLDESRLAQEVAILADKCDITEELVRFRSHLSQFDSIMALAEPVGRKLDFLLQEMNREVNTIGSKANDAKMALFVVDLKAELEKIREQVQNIE